MASSKYMKTTNADVSINSRDSVVISINENQSNPFDKFYNWEDFKREYYTLEKRIKRSLENMHVIQIEFTKQISLLE